VKSYNNGSSKAENSIVNNQKSFVLAFRTTKSSRNSLEFDCLSCSLLMHPMLSVNNISWIISTVWFFCNYFQSQNDLSADQLVAIKLRNKGPRGLIN